MGCVRKIYIGGSMVAEVGRGVLLGMELKSDWWRVVNRIAMDYNLDEVNYMLKYRRLSAEGKRLARIPDEWEEEMAKEKVDRKVKQRELENWRGKLKGTDYRENKKICRREERSENGELVLFVVVKIAWSECCPPGFVPLTRNRPQHMGSREGGLAIIISKELHVEVKIIAETTHETFEALTVKVNGKRPLLNYRPPPNPKNNYMTARFLDEIDKNLTSLFIKHRNDIIICGNFDLHWNCQNDSHIKTFRNLLDTLDMSQHINKPRHQSGNKLDLLITNCDASERVRIVHVDDVAISDHSLITFTFATDRIQQQSVLKKCRKLKRMNMSDFTTTLERNLGALIQDCMNTQQLENLVYQYNQAVKSSLDTHAPISITKIRLKGEDRKPWYDD
ncbi:hypothetical protein CAPTEDRAFT_200542 [Capitella teleta]|uniref:Endonuclease/exonuclease/phosphatase domain-containing protein n=1 Tax=Capitella teleta TaxID=283909 RepID=R7T856_CAPTE|nr:hypothetical protein CAPTEDRAFT_200542 [Capitella teleta]|eukprot:ELT89854.1 hypothetical protein CAPTEDRAFT_200542 [Capitella teleta]